jgi:hypothetical protein
VNRAEARAASAKLSPSTTARRPAGAAAVTSSDRETVNWAKRLASVSNRTARIARPTNRAPNR